jgi:D-amino-acid oxidase
LTFFDQPERPMDRRLTRRDWLRLTGTSVAGVALGACATGQRPGGAYPRIYAKGPFFPPRIDPHLVVRTLVGLRPYRPSGFVVRAQRLGDKTLIHNYGHGGGGITLSWGSSALAVREAPDAAPRRAAVLGCGIMGLTTARLLQDRGWSVTIFTKQLPPHTTSNVAGGQWTPVSVFEEGHLTPPFAGQFREAARIAYHAFAGLVGRDYGVRWIENYYLRDEPFGEGGYYLRELPELFPGVADFGPGEHPFVTPYVRRIVTMLVEPGVHLRRLLGDVRHAGGRVVIRELRDPAEVVALEEPVVFNCTGLGTAKLFGDPELVPVRGQVVFLPPDPLVDYLTIGGGEGVLYMFPRSDGILLGGTFQHGREDTDPDAGDTARMLREHARIATGMRLDRE